MSFWMGLPIAAICFLQSAIAQSARVALVELAEVSTPLIRVSDLLPGAAPAALRNAGEAVDLGRAPQPGTLRILAGEQIVAALNDHEELLRQISVPERIVVRRRAWPIPEDVIQSAIGDVLRRREGMDTDSPARIHIDWPREMLSTEPNPTLEIMGTRWQAESGKLQIRMRCMERDVCGSFLVRAIVPRMQLPSARVDHRVAGQQTAIAWAAKSGETAKMIFDNAGVHIAFPVVCLQSGRLQDEIRVRNVGGVRVLRARVVGRGELQAIF